MKLISLIKAKFHLSNDCANKLEWLNEYTYQDISFECNDTYTIEKKCSHLIHETIIHKEIANSTNNATIGADELLIKLQHILSDETIYIQFIDANSWSGNIYFNKNNEYIGLLLGKKKKEKRKTPPNWDGSLEMLETFNSKNNSKADE
jgi:hypothetical protein